MVGKRHNIIMIVLAILAICVPLAAMALTGVFNIKTDFAVMQQVIATNSVVVKEIREDVKELKVTTTKLQLDFGKHEARGNGSEKRGR